MPQTSPGQPLVDLLGETRGHIVAAVQRRACTAADLAAEIGISTAAVRRHLQVLEADGLLSRRSEHTGDTGRPSDRWSLTTRGRRLFADRSAEFADELLAHIEQRFGRRAVMEFLKDRNARQADRYAADLEDESDPTVRAERLAEALSADGFAAAVVPSDDGRRLTLLQNHCAIEGIAKEHPEICAHEAALFTRVLGTPEIPIKVSRRDTIATGAHACVCHIDLPESATRPTRTNVTDRSA